MTNRLLLRGGYVLTMDSDLGDLPIGDILIENGAIAAVEMRIDADVDAEILDVKGHIVLPGFVDTHRHTWEAAIRGCAVDATLDTFYVDVLDTFAPIFRAEDMYAGNYVGALECLNAGITTLVDWSHINNTPEHPDAAVRALREAGIRAQYAFGGIDATRSGQWHESEIGIAPAEVRRVRETHFPTEDVSQPGLLTMALAVRGPGFCKNDVVQAEWALARELGIPLTMHAAMGRMAGRFGMVKILGDLRLLGPDITYIHCCYLSDEEWRMIADSGGSVSLAPQVEAQMGAGWSPVMKAIEHGLRPSLSIDTVTAVPGDMFTQMRSAFGTQRARLNAVAWEADAPLPDTMITARGILAMATLNGARAAGLEDHIGSLTPGKRADVVVIDATALNVSPVTDPVAAVTLCADVSNVKTVIVDGVVRKRDGRLLADLNRARGLIEASHDHLLEQAKRRSARTVA